MTEHSDKNATSKEIHEMNFVEKVIITLVLMAILFFGYYLRVVNIGAPVLWADENELFYSSTGTYKEIISRKYFLDESVHETPDGPLTLLLVRLLIWADVGIVPSDVNEQTREAFRTPFAAAGILAVLLLFYLASDIFSLRWGLVAASLNAFLIYPIYYSREGRPYAFFLLWVTASALFFYKMVQKPTTVRMLFFIVFVTFTLYTHYFSLFFLTVVYVWTALFLFIVRYEQGPGIGRGFSIRMALALVAIFACYLPWLAALLKAVDQGMRGVPEPIVGFAPKLGYNIYYFCSLMSHWSSGFFLVPGAFALAVVGLIRLFIFNRKGAALIVPWLIVPWLILPWIPGSGMTHFRHLIFGFPAFILLLVAGLQGIYGLFSNLGSAALGKVLGALAVLALLGMLFFHSYLAMPDLVDKAIKCDGDCRERYCAEFITPCIQKQDFKKVMLEPFAY